MPQKVPQNDMSFRGSFYVESCNLTRTFFVFSRYLLASLSARAQEDLGDVRIAADLPACSFTVTVMEWSGPEGMSVII